MRHAPIPPPRPSPNLPPHFQASAAPKPGRSGGEDGNRRRLAQAAPPLADLGVAGPRLGLGRGQSRARRRGIRLGGLLRCSSGGELRSRGVALSPELLRALEVESGL